MQLSPVVFGARFGFALALLALLAGNYVKCQAERAVRTACLPPPDHCA